MPYEDKLWLQSSLNKMAQQRAEEAIQNTGRSLPCTVVSVNASLVLVSFQVANAPWTLPSLWLPKAESQWLRAPVQAGDVGMTVPADTLLAGISGQGSGVADMSVQYPNMSTLVWIPVAATSFQATPDPNKVWLNGPNGFLMTDSGSPPTVGVTGDKSLQRMTIFCGDQMIVLTVDPTISMIVSAGGFVGVGAAASTLLACNAAAAQQDLQSLANGPQGIVNQTLVNLCTAIGAAANGTLTGGAAFEALIAASSFVPNIANILPAIPDCSSIARLAP